MSSKRDEFAARMNGREYLDEITRAEDQEASKAGLLIVFGASDDLTEFRGLLRDEAGAYRGVEHKIISDDRGWSIASGDDECPRCKARMQKMRGVIIKAEWCPEGFSGSWRMSSPVPHATFDIMEDGELFCRGIVIDEADMFAALAAPVPA